MCCSSFPGLTSDFDLTALDWLRQFDHLWCCRLQVFANWCSIWSTAKALPCVVWLGTFQSQKYRSLYEWRFLFVCFYKFERTTVKGTGRASVWSCLKNQLRFSYSRLTAYRSAKSVSYEIFACYDKKTRRKIFLDRGRLVLVCWKGKRRSFSHQFCDDFATIDAQWCLLDNLFEFRIRRYNL